MRGRRLREYDFPSCQRAGAEREKYLTTRDHAISRMARGKARCGVGCIGPVYAIPYLPFRNRSTKPS